MDMCQVTIHLSHSLYNRVHERVNRIGMTISIPKAIRKRWSFPEVRSQNKRSRKKFGKRRERFLARAASG